MKSSSLLLAAATAALVLIPVQSASARDHWDCRASAISITVLGGAEQRPVDANDPFSPCRTSNGGLPGLGAVTPITTPLLGVDTAYAITDERVAGIAPARQHPTAVAGVENLRLNAAGSLLSVGAVEARITADCVGTTPRYTTTHTVARVSLGGTELPVDRAVHQLITDVTNPLIGSVVRIDPGERTQTADGVLYRALRVRVPANGSIVDARIGEVELGANGNPCANTRDPADPDQRDGGGRLVPLDSLTGALAHSPCVTGAFGRPFVLLGTNEVDRITGTAKADRIIGLGSGDVLNGGNGRDCIDGRGGNDVLSGGSFHDTLVGSSGNDRLSGGHGDDTLSGGAGNDNLDGGTGNDRIHGGAGRDLIVTGQGKDVVDAGPGDDHINSAYRSNSSDRIDCGPGNDVVRASIEDRVRHCERVIRIR